MKKTELAQDTRRGIEHCKVCGKPTQKIVNIPYIGCYNKIVGIPCDCRKKELENQEKQDKFNEIQKQIDRLKTNSLLGKRYKDVCFENTALSINKSVQNAYSRCKKYCENHKQVIEHGWSVYIFGSIGVGKTHLTACMANYLLSKRVPVMVTNVFEISQAVKRTFSKNSTSTEQQIIDNFGNIPILFVDDLGTEDYINSSKSEWLNSVMSQIVNKRYNSKKPTVFSSNYSLNELISKRGMWEMTVDRISEMTQGAVIKITGKSMRINIKKELPF